MSNLSKLKAMAVRLTPKGLLPLVLSIVPFLTWGAFLWDRTFPAGDGGLWYVMAREIMANHGLPITKLSFNGDILPLGYPPLSAYLLIAVKAVTEVDLLSLMVWIPYSLNLLSLIFFYLFAKSYFANSKIPQAGVWTTVSYSFLLHSCHNFFSGGALPRSLGLNFIFLSWWILCRTGPCKGNAWKKSLLGAISLAGAALSHPTAALWSAGGVVFLSIFEARASNRQLMSCLALAALMVAPWVLYVLSGNNIEIFFKAFSVGADEMWGWRRLGQPESFLMPGGFLGALGLLGIMLLVRERMFAPPLLLLMGLLIDHRGLFVLHGVSIAALGLGVSGIGLSRYFKAIDSSQGGALAPWLFIILGSAPLVVYQASFIAERVNQTHEYTAVDTLAEYESIINAFKPRERIALLAGRWELINGEWLSALSNFSIFPLPQAQEWTGRYAEQIEIFNKLAGCCSSGGWSCVKDSISSEELKSRNFLVELTSCSSILHGYEGGIDFITIPNFAILKPEIKQ